jgi:aldehyde dehydrogenase (NAD+)
MEVATRKFLIKEIEKDILKYEEKILVALKKDLGKCEFEGVVAEVQYCLSEIDHILKKIDKWTRPKKVFTPAVHWPAKSYIFYEPFGHVLVIAPWNYPFQLCISPLVGALSAGNKVTIKPSEVTSETENIIVEIFSSDKYKNYVDVVTGGVEKTTKLLEKKFDYIFYTGSTNVGRIIMQAASKHLTPVTLELGGKSPAIVLEDADLEVTARRIIWGKLMNSGQTCIAPDYVLVPRSIKKKLLSFMTNEIKKFYGDNPIESSDYGSIVNLNHFKRLRSLIPEKVFFGGYCDESTLKISPTIIEASENDSIMSDEIFGPILPVLELESLDKGIELIRSKDKPLALYLFTKSNLAQNKVVKSISFGGGVINDTLIHIANGNLPFGGVGPSGVGSYHCRHSFVTFSHKKSVIKRSFAFDLSLRYPPYLGKLRIIRWLLKLIG